MDARAQAILDFWFDEVGPDRWWVRSAETDAAIVERFSADWEARRQRRAEDFLGSPREALAAILLFDQFSRNMFRHRAKAFATDPLALAIAKDALDRGYADTLSESERSFLYMPLMHSEQLDDQERAVGLFEALGWPEPARFARLHRDMIATFGRFPARNAALGRADRSGEAEAIAASSGW